MTDSGVEESVVRIASLAISRVPPLIVRELTGFVPMLLANLTLALPMESDPSARAPAAVMFRRPALTVVGPVKLLEPERVTVPEPVRVSPPVPRMLPEIVNVLVLGAISSVVDVARVRGAEMMWLPLKTLIAAEGPLRIRLPAEPGAKV